MQVRTVHDQVRQFMRRDYLDIRIEIVDHILNIIIEECEGNTHYQFYSSLNDAIDSLGGQKGIREIEFNRKYELWKQYVLGHYRALVDAFRIPQLVLSLGVLYLLYNITHQLDKNSFWMIMVMCCITGLVESIDRWGRRGWVDEHGSTLTSFIIYARSGFVTNTPLLIIYLIWVFIPDYWISDFIVTLSFFMYLIFFVFRFYFLRGEVRRDILKYRSLVYV